MSECIGEGCTEPGCSGKNAGVVNAQATGMPLGMDPAKWAVMSRRERRPYVLAGRRQARKARRG